MLIVSGETRECFAWDNHVSYCTDRSHKVKCDETRPACLLCTSKGRICGGYYRGYRFSRKHEIEGIFSEGVMQFARPRESTVHGATGSIQGPDYTGTEAPLNTGRLTRVSEVEVDEGTALHDADEATPDQTENITGLDLLTIPWTPANQHNGVIADEFQDSFPETHVAIGNGGEPAQTGSLSQSADLTTNTSFESHYPLNFRSSASSSDGLSHFLDTLEPDSEPRGQDICASAESAPQWSSISSGHHNEPRSSLEGTQTAWFDLDSSSHVPSKVLPKVHSLLHMPSFLVTYWFERVCLVWSGYDSYLNTNRNIAAQIWQNSEPVYHCLQSMSAACLSTNIPQMRRHAVISLQSAVESTLQQLSHYSQREKTQNFPVAAIFALLCLGTSSSWIEASHLGTPYFKKARALVHRLAQQSPDLSVSNKQLLVYFEECLAYCEMLLVAAGSEYAPRQRHVVDEGFSTEVTAPHPWTGICPSMPRTLTKVLTLCRHFRSHTKDICAETYHLQAALGLIAEAKTLDMQLQNAQALVEFTGHLDGQTADLQTPWKHFSEVAEAYRLASMLHLYQTFADVAAKYTPRQVQSMSDCQARWIYCITPTSFRLIELLRKIPVESGTKIMQVFLLISAGTGLRHSEGQTYATPTDDRLGSPTSLENLEILDYAAQLRPSGSATEDAPNTMTQATLNVGEARDFVSNRLAALENVLPPKPIACARQLVEAIWTSYDDEENSNLGTHWIDIMDSSGLKSFFG